ncbi:MAG: hypothetical protein QXQ57_02060 [Sulfolobales archaeon]
MNFVSFHLADLVATSNPRDTAAGHPMTISINPSNMLPTIAQYPKITVAPLIAIILVLLAYVFQYRTVTDMK